MEFKIKMQSEIQKMSETEADVYFTAKAENDTLVMKKAITDAVEPLELKLKETTENLETTALSLKDLQEKGTQKNQTFLQEVTQKKSEIIELVKGSGSKELVLKANTVRASIDGNTDSIKLSGIGQFGRKKRSLYDLFRKTTIKKGNHNGKVVYHDWDEATTVLAAASVLEGAIFPESTANFKEYKEDLIKIGDSLPVSEEFGEDEVMASAELERFLDLNVNSVIDTQLANGAGVGGTLKGLQTIAPVFVPTSSGIIDANIYDLAKRMRTGIVKNRGSKYDPNFVSMNSDTYDRLVLKKDANNNYIFPDRDRIGSMLIVEDNNLPDNQLTVGDSRYGEIYEMTGVVISKVHVNDQALKDMITLKARVRMLFLVRNVDRTGFLKCTNITTALAALA